MLLARPTPATSRPLSMPLTIGSPGAAVLYYLSIVSVRPLLNGFENKALTETGHETQHATTDINKLHRLTERDSGLAHYSLDYFGVWGYVLAT